MSIVNKYVKYSQYLSLFIYLPFLSRPRSLSLYIYLTPSTKAVTFLSTQRCIVYRHIHRKLLSD